MPQQKIKSLQSFRALIMFTIFIVHVQPLIRLPLWFPFPIAWLGGPCLEMFFILSGFMVAYNHYNSNVLPCTVKAAINYCKKKLKQFYPLHLLTFLLIIPIVIKNFNNITNGSLNDKLKLLLEGVSNLLLLQSWIPSPDYYFSFNGVSWFLSDILFCYFMTPFILCFFKKLKTNSNLLICLTFLITFRFVFETFWKNFVGYKIGFVLYVFPPYRLIEYSIGLLIGILFLQIQSQKNEQNIVMSTIPEIIAVAFIFIGFSEGDSNWSDSAYMLFEILLIFILAIGNGLIVKIISNKILMHFGEISFEFFIIHQIIIKYIYLFWPKFIKNNFYYQNTVKWLFMFFVSLFISEIVHKLLPKIINKLSNLHIAVNIGKV